jgi:pilus assembly protein TadC
MLESVYQIAAIAAGACCAIAVIAVGDQPRGLDAAAWLQRSRGAEGMDTSARPGTWARALAATGTRRRLSGLIERAGWNESPERLAAFAVGLSACIAVLSAATSSVVGWAGIPVLALVGLASGIGLCSLVLRTAIVSRRRRLTGELIPFMELFTLELSGGGSALSALGTVSMKLDGELARDVRRLLIASQVVGSAPFESRLLRYSENLDIPAIASVATILAASREYGTGALQGVRALAADLRRAQRRDLIVQSRKALNHVLLPAGVGVLLPFLGVVMFPAVSALQRNLY